MTAWSSGPLKLIPGEMRGAYPHCHSLYIEGTGVLIDPSSDREELLRLRNGPGVESIWLTHWHEDHWMYINLFDHHPLCISRPDAVPLSDLEVFIDCYGLPEQRNDMREDFRNFIKDRFCFRSRKAERFLRPGEVVTLGTIKVEILHTPGHTPGHLSFYFPDEEVLFLGDYDLTPFGPWYGDKHSSLEQCVSSVKRLREIPAKVWLSSHGKGIFEEQPGVLWDQYLGTIRTREERLLELLAAPRSMDEIVGEWIVYGQPREPKIFFEFGERAIMSKHLNRLIELGRVVLEQGRYVRI